MKPSELEERVISIIAETLNIAPERLTPQSSFAADLDADSVAMVDVLMALEDDFSISLVDQYKREVATVGDVIGFVAAQLNP